MVATLSRYESFFRSCLLSIFLFYQISQYTYHIVCCAFAVVFMELLKIMWMLLMLTDHVFIENIKKALEQPGQLVAPLDVPLAPITGCKTITENNFKDMAKKLRRKQCVIC